MGIAGLGTYSSTSFYYAMKGISSPYDGCDFCSLDNNLIEERSIDINSINPNYADSYEMYALSAYGEKSGKCPDAVARFTMMHAKQEIEQTAKHGSYSLDTKEDWIGILNEILKEQLDM